MKRKFKFAPLDGSFMAISIFGLFVSIFYVMNPSMKIGSLFLAFFLVMFIISLFDKGSSSLAYTLTFVLGIIASIIFSYAPNITWGYAFIILFGVMFVSSVVSMTVANPYDFVEIEKDFSTSLKKKKK